MNKLLGHTVTARAMNLLAFGQAPKTVKDYFPAIPQERLNALLFLLAIAFSFQTVPAFSGPSPATFEAAVRTEESGSFKVLNDTGGEVQIHTGGGFVELNKGASTSITCETGRDIRRANKGKKGDVIFVVDDSMCGKTVKLSKYL